MFAIGPHSPVLSGQSWRGYNALQISRKLGQGTPTLCLDAGDAISLPASATQWKDISGNGYDFDFGTTGGADATDPTQNGTVGRLSSGEYLSGDGGDYLEYETTNETWMQNIHKDSATWTMDFWHYSGAIGSAYRLAGTTSTLSQIGFRVGIAATGSMSLQIANGTGTAVLDEGSGIAIGSGVWAYLAVSVDEPNSLVTWCVNGVFATDAVAYASPSASSASFAMCIGARGGGGEIMPSGSRLAIVRALTRALSASEMLAYFNATRGRFNA